MRQRAISSIYRQFSNQIDLSSYYFGSKCQIKQTIENFIFPPSPSHTQPSSHDMKEEEEEEDEMMRDEFEQFIDSDGCLLQSSISSGNDDQENSSHNNQPSLSLMKKWCEFWKVDLTNCLGER